GWDAVQYLAAAHGIITQRSRVIGRHVAGSNRVHIDSLARPFIGQSLGKLRHSAFRSGIGRDQNSSLERKQRRNVHNLSFGTTLQHILRSELRDPEYRAQVGSDDLIPIVEWKLRCRGAPDYSSVVHQNIDGSELVDGTGDEMRLNFVLRNIARKMNTLAAELPDFVACGPALLRASVTCDICTGLSKGDCDRRTKSAA